MMEGINILAINLNIIKYFGFYQTDEDYDCYFIKNTKSYFEHFEICPKRTY